MAAIRGVHVLCRTLLRSFALDLHKLAKLRITEDPLALSCSQTARQRILNPKTIPQPGEAAECSDLGHQGLQVCCRPGQSHDLLSSSLHVRQSRNL